MIGRLKCSWCKNRFFDTSNSDEWKCRAFPDGIPEEKLMFITRDPCVDCKNGIGFAPDNTANKDNRP